MLTPRPWETCNTNCISNQQLTAICGCYQNWFKGHKPRDRHGCLYNKFATENCIQSKLKCQTCETISSNAFECFGKVIVNIGIPGLHCSYTWTVVVMDTINLLLGADFLCHYGLILDCCNGRLINETIHCYIQGGQITAQIQNIMVNNHDHLPEVQFFLQEFLKSPDYVQSSL